MNFKIIWDKEAKKELKKLERFLSIRIYRKINLLKENINSLDIKRLKNSNLFRLRIGDYRVLFEIKKETITILKISNRKNTYKN